ncbi:hypothetical protein EXIGLDRAFT_699390 [Exidia glandulosa HHB12029]|uniref:Ubiquitin 3 binding protein But2 C-terminal domain-containing protein n=1 Tax=Exidia glandulosa HHB12029 TaxID=1314781 RepID=A0A165DWX4_EXIGL|nr:hypothetical protein EXIGLDRAFT_699390 [Exidia glandulosa HHB12029]
MKAEYEPMLQEHDDSSSAGSSEDTSPRSTHKHEPLHPLALWTYIACLSLCVLNIGLLLRGGLKTEAVVDPETLERPSTYIDLDTVKWNASRLAALPPVTNFPMVLAPVSRTDTAKVWPVDPKAWLSDKGTISPDSREVLLSQDTSMIMQFRVLDHKMERCSLVAAIPTEAEIRGRHRDNNVDLDGDTLVHVYRLDAARKLDARTLSYATKPKRLDHVGHFTVKLGAMNGTAEFDCKERTLQTFEVTCPGKRCHINFWQNRDSPVMAFYLRQTHSLPDPE